VNTVLRKRQAGFTYLAILFAVAIVGVMLAGTGLDWSHASRREKERELLFIGSQFRQAIALYYQRTPGAVKRYPANLDNLIDDRRYNPPQHYLRKIYRDPITSQAQWGLVMAPEGGIMGVHSLSEAVPIKTSGFRDADVVFEGTKKYADWLFSYIPPSPVP